MVITSVNNPQVKMWEKLKNKKFRDEHGLFVIQQSHLIEEALKKNCVETLLVREGCDNPFAVEPVYVSDSVMKKICTNVSLNDCAAVCRKLTYDKPQSNSVIILENVQDPGNVGTIIRTAYSFGYDAVYLTEGCADEYNEKTIQSSQGAMFHIPVIRAGLSDTVNVLKKKGVHIVATSLDSSHFLKEAECHEKFALMFGNEGQGLSEAALSLADERIKIEMAAFESLNVASAMAIAAYYYKNINCQKK